MTRMLAVKRNVVCEISMAVCEHFLHYKGVQEHLKDLQLD